MLLFASFNNESVVDTVDVLTVVVVPLIIKLPVTVVSPDIVPPDELNLVFELSKAACAITLAELALAKAASAVVVAVFALSNAPFAWVYAKPAVVVAVLA